MALRRGYEDLRLQQMTADPETVQEIREQASKRATLLPEPVRSKPPVVAQGETRLTSSAHLPK